jgi:hypothetical protein
MPREIRIICLLPYWIGLFWLSPSFVLAQMQGDVEALEEVVALAEQNRTAIVTWSGEAEIKREVIGQDEQPRLVRRVRFWQDSERGIRCSEVVQPGPVQFNITSGDGENRQLEFRQITTFSARTNDALIVREVREPDDGRALLTVHSPLPTGRPAMQHQEWPASDVFVPEAHFSALNNDTTEMMSSLLASRNNLGAPVTVQRKENLVFVLLLGGMAGNMYTFDLDQGGCLVEFGGGRQDDDGTAPWSVIQIEYARNGATFAPVHWRREQQVVVVGREEDGRRHVIDEVVFAATRVNQELEENQFTFAALGAENGDPIVDDRNNRRSYRIGRDLDVDQRLDEMIHEP